MPSFLHKREAPVPASVKPPILNPTIESPTELPILNTSEQPHPNGTQETGGKTLEKHIFGNKKYHPSHGRTTPFPEPGIS